MASLWHNRTKSASNEYKFKRDLKQAMTNQAAPQYWWDVEELVLLMHSIRKPTTASDILSAMDSGLFQMSPVNMKGHFEFRVKSNKKDIQEHRKGKRRRAIILSHD